MTTDGQTMDQPRFDGATDQGKTGLAGVLERAEEKAMDLGKNAIHAIDSKRVTAAGTLSGAAGQLHAGGDKVSQLTQSGGEKVAQLAHGAADSLQASADFVRDHDLKAMVGSVEQYVRSNPGKALIAASVVGFLAARAIRND